MDTCIAVKLAPTAPSAEADAINAPKPVASAAAATPNAMVPVAIPRASAVGVERSVSGLASRNWRTAGRSRTVFHGERQYVRMTVASPITMHTPSAWVYDRPRRVQHASTAHA